MSTDWTHNFGQLDRTAPTWAPKRPVRIALLGDFSAGAAAGRLDTGSDLARRKPISVEFDTLEDALSRLDVKLNLPLGEQGSVELDITELESFHPDELYRNLALFSQLSSLRKQLNDTATFAKAAATVQGWADGKAKKASRTSRKSKARGAAPAADAKLSDFARLVGLPSAPDDAPAASGGADALIRSIVAPFIVPAASPNKDALIASVDNALSDALRAVLHHADFQTLESLWRGADFLLRRLETGPGLQVHLIDLSAEEFAADLSSTDDLAETALYKLLVENPSQDKTGGYTLLCGLYQFEATPPHAELLGRIAQIAQQANAPFVTSFSIDGLTDRKKPPHALVQDALRALQGLPSASHLSLMAPRFMLRHPYGKRSDPISSFDFEEFTTSEGLRGMLWGHPALLAACAVAGNDGLAIGDLPFYHFKDKDGDNIALPTTERLLNTDAATTLRDWGISPLLAHKGAPELRLAGLDAVNGAALGKAAPPSSSKPRVGVDTKIGIGSQLTVVTRKPTPSSKPAASNNDDDLLSSSSDSSSGGDDDLDALLAGLGDDSSSSSDSSSGGDDDLDALLASLGGDDSSSSSSDDSASSGGGDDEMDPELAALLASLE